ncbi:MAG: alpha/beta hydrolase family protein [Gammaproteobacteria bacterium]
MRFIFALALVCLGCVFTVQAAPPAAELFGSLPKIYDAAISPTGKQVALIRVVQGQYAVQVKTLGLKGEKPRLVGLEKGVKPTSIVWVNPDRLIVSFWQSSKLRDVPYTSGFLFSLDTKKMKGKILVKPEKGVFRQYNHVVVDYLEDDPDNILMAFSKDDNNVKPDLRKVNVDTGRSRIVQRGLKSVQYWHTDLRGEPRVGQGRRDRSTEEWNLRIRDANGKDWREAEDYPGLSADVDIRGFTADPDELIIADYQGKNTLGLYIYNLQEKNITRTLFHNDKYDAGGVILSHDGTEIMGATYVGETSEVELFDGYATALSTLRKEYSDYTVDYIDQSSKAGLIIVRISNAYEPGMVALYDARKKQLSVLGELYPDLLPEQMGEVVSVGYSARDGVKIPSFVTLPPTIKDGSQLKKLPFVILPHGGPYGRDEKRFDYFAQFFATRGFGVMQMNFRGSDGYGKAFEDSGRKNWVVMQEDVEDGARSLIERGYADPDRICIAGWSYGGYAALMGALKSPELYACAISMAGVTDLQDMIRDIEKYRFGKVTARNFVLNGFESKDDIKANSPVKLAGELKVPLFLAHGRDDQRVHFDQFTRMKRALRKVDVPVTYMDFSDEDHFLSNQENRVEFFNGIDKFLAETVGTSEFAL